MTKRQYDAIQEAARTGYAVKPPRKEDDDTAYRKRGVGVPNSVRRSVYERDGWRCALCDDPRSLQIHHAVHRSLGGSDRMDNLITLCWRCHAVAHGQRFDDYPDYVTQDYMEQAIVEYLSDWWAENYPDEPQWYPYK